MDGRTFSGSSGDNTADPGSPLVPSVGNPRSIDTGTEGTISILKARSLLDTGGNCYEVGATGRRSCFDHIEVLTVVSSVPEDAGSAVMRPAYFGPDKRSVRLAEVNWDVLPDLPIHTTPGDRMKTIEPWDNAIDGMKGVKPDFTCGSVAGVAQIKAFKNWGVNNGYGGHVWGEFWTNAWGVLHEPVGAGDIAKRDELRIHMLQVGLDKWNELRYGGGNCQSGNHPYGGSWPPEGGFGQGRYGVVWYAAVLVNDGIDRISFIKDLETTALKRQAFAETSQITFGATQILYGAKDVPGGKTWACPQTGNQVEADPDGLGDGCGEGSYNQFQGPYQPITYHAFKAQALFLRLIPDAEQYMYTHLGDYIDRMRAVGTIGQDGVTTRFGVLNPTCNGGPAAGLWCGRTSAGHCPSSTCAEGSDPIRKSDYWIEPAETAWETYGDCWQDYSCPGMPNGPLNWATGDPPDPPDPPPAPPIGTRIQGITEDGALQQ